MLIKQKAWATQGHVLRAARATLLPALTAAGRHSLTTSQDGAEPDSTPSHIHGFFTHF